ncbi:MAG: hypothetical protein ABIN66_05010, partial [candidate division WOR-3 bacterium]
MALCIPLHALITETYPHETLSWQAFRETDFVAKIARIDPKRAHIAHTIRTLLGVAPELTQGDGWIVKSGYMPYLSLKFLLGLS